MTRATITKYAIIAILTGLILALVAPSLRPGFLEIPGMNTAPRRGALFPLRAGWLLLPFGALACSLWAFLTGRLSGFRLTLIAILGSYTTILCLAFLDPHGSFALPRRVFENSYGRDALVFDSWEELWSDYEERSLDLTGHGRTHPPGSAALYWLSMRGGRMCARLSGAGADSEYEAFVAEGYLAGYLWPFLQVLWLIPAWCLGRRLYGDRPAGIAITFGALAPSAVVIAPAVDGLLPLIAVSALLCLDRGLQERRLLWSALGGVICAVGTTITFGFGALSPLFLIYFLLRRHGRGRLRWEQLIALLAGGLAWVLFLRVAWGYSAIDRLVNGVNYHQNLAVNDVRPYGPFLIISPFIFLVWAGVPASCGFLTALLHSKPVSALRGVAVDPLAIAMGSTLLLLSLSGSSRGETERMWLSLLPMLILGAGRGLDGKAGKNSSATSIGLILMLALTMVSAWLLGQWHKFYH
ncbi:MAG: hypothetical protein CMJ89_12790 [Planctomycetes bacterium]|nr:hypothetical protein [Planctomycetota bacterium]